MLLSEGQSLNAEIPTPPPYLNISRGAESKFLKEDQAGDSYEIAKVGRTSRWTRGTINAAQSRMFIRNKTTTLERVF
jgi:hypothetical protein